MNYKNNQLGQISILAMIGIGISVIIPTIGGYFYQSRKTDDKINFVEEKIGSVKERTAKLEEAVETIKKDNSETRKDIKDFLKELNKKK